MANSKKISNPFSTGGGGHHFEAHVQASFVVLMLTGGFAPCLPCWPIAEVKLQGKIDGFDTDDLIIVVENTINQERRKLLGQIKHSIAITPGSTVLGEVIQAAWNDFNNSEIFSKGKDIIALITGPLSATDANNVQWLLTQARHTKNSDDFYRNVRQANFSPSKSSEKLGVIRQHLKAANKNNDISDAELYQFLRHFHLLGYDLGNERGVILSLLHSHISQFQSQYPEWLWSRIVDVVQTWNQNAGTITRNNISEDILDAIKQKTVVDIPDEFKATPEVPKYDWIQHPDATYLALAVLIGSWEDSNQSDIEVLAQHFGIGYDKWLGKARDILHCPDSPLSLKNGIWKVNNRPELWNLLGSRILDQNLDTFKALAVSVLKEQDPAFELASEERYAARFYGKVLKYSHTLRKGIAEGLAILGSQVDASVNCSQGKAERTCLIVLRELLTDADWRVWGTLNGLLPILAEAAPSEFLNMLEKGLGLTPNPFDELFSQEGNGFTGQNYLTGLLWALEGLAWDEQCFVRACVALAELASHDPGGQSGNRPFNSLITILLPWLPQTLAPAEKRKVAVKTILQECPEVFWKIIINLLPGQNEMSAGTYKPRWRKIIPDNWEKGVSNQEYWDQTSFFSKLAVDAAGHDVHRLTALIDHFGNLPKPAFEYLIEILGSESVTELPEEQRLLIWNHLKIITKKHRRFSDAKWALPDEAITLIEKASEHFTPTKPFYLYQHLFGGRDYDFCEDGADWEERNRILNKRRDEAMVKVYQQDGVEGAIRFAESVSSPGLAGYALGGIQDALLESIVLPHFLDKLHNKRLALASSFISRRYHQKGWEWCDGIDKSGWTPEQTGQFLACLPFTQKAWDRASEWLQARENEYWICVDANAYLSEDDYSTAIANFIKHGRPHVAINRLDMRRHTKKPISPNQCTQALLAAISSKEPHHDMDGYHIVELIKYLQEEPSVNQEDLFRIEWAYVSLLDGHRGVTPKLLGNKLANTPEFFCEIIQLIFRPTNDVQPVRELTEDLKAIATNAWQLLEEWKIPPGTQKDKTFSEEEFTRWLQTVKTSCTESGHLEVALLKIGEVLIYTPPDEDGLWIRRVVASALNDRDADAMRSGFRTKVYNSRGIHHVDPTGAPERKLAEQYRRKAEEIENAGFQRFAATLKGLADSYDREAEQVIAEH